MDVAGVFEVLVEGGVFTAVSLRSEPSFLESFGTLAFMPERYRLACNCHGHTISPPTARPTANSSRRAEEAGGLFRFGWPLWIGWSLRSFRRWIFHEEIPDASGAGPLRVGEIRGWVKHWFLTEREGGRFACGSFFGGARCWPFKPTGSLHLIPPWNTSSSPCRSL